MTDTHWGKAGERLTARAARSRANLRLIDQARTAEREAHRIHRTREKWAMGLVIPHHITMALDAVNLYGPEVDIACGTVEPAVDEWEAGTRYPTWPQLEALADLTGRAVWWFTAPVHEIITPGHTSLRFHLPRDHRDPEPILSFTEHALYEARKFGVNP